MAPAVRPGLVLIDNHTAGSYNDSDIWLSLWTVDTISTNDIEIWGYPVGGEAGAALSGWRFGFMMANSVPGSNFNGYLFLRESALGDFIYWRRYDNGVHTDIPNTVFTESYSPLLLARRVGDALEAWHCNTSDGTGTWTLITTVNDSTYHGPWKLFIGIEDPSHVGTGWAGIGGGAQMPPPQIYRIVRGSISVPS